MSNFIFYLRARLGAGSLDGLGTADIRASVLEAGLGCSTTGVGTEITINCICFSSFFKNGDLFLPPYIDILCF